MTSTVKKKKKGPGGWELRWYLKAAVAHLLAKPAAALLSDPGVGKTLCVLLAFWLARKKNPRLRLLIVAPLNPCYEVWPAEIEKWKFPFTHHILHGKFDPTIIDEEMADVYIINYDGLRKFTSTIIGAVTTFNDWWLVLDESTKVKNTQTLRFKTLRPLLSLFARRTILTGTPAPNGLIDLFGQVYCLDFGVALGRYVTQYRRAFFYPSGYGGYTWVLQADGEERIYERLDGLAYRVPDSVLGLPPPLYSPLYVRLSPKVMARYKQLEDEFVTALRGRVITAVNAGVLTAKLRQLANGGLYDTHDGKWSHVHNEKLDAVVDEVEQLQGSPLLIGYQFTADGREIAKALKAPLINGDVSPKERRPIFAAFNRGELPAIVCQEETVALGLNLQEACHNVLHYGLTWNLETWIQFNKRVHRGGQKKKVVIRPLLARDTIDELQWTVLGKKNANQQRLLAALTGAYRG